MDIHAYSRYGFSIHGFQACGLRSGITQSFVASPCVHEMPTSTILDQNMGQLIVAKSKRSEN